MKFCTECNNMYYIKINGEDQNSLIYYCRFCGHEDDEPAETGIVVLRTDYKKTEQQFSHMINRYIKYDNTLPRINNVKCPNESCKKHESGESSSASSASATASSSSASATNTSNIIYLRYDDNNMKYLYICEDCDTTWKTDDNK
jgi:DNA-directed RNA polymerase subunit M/transcription elongation factor TFIIS